MLNVLLSVLLISNACFLVVARFVLTLGPSQQHVLGDLFEDCLGLVLLVAGALGTVGGCAVCSSASAAFEQEGYLGPTHFNASLAWQPCFVLFGYLVGTLCAL